MARGLGARSWRVADALAVNLEGSIPLYDTDLVKWNVTGWSRKDLPVCLYSH